jgi:outer membrane lipoprotein carrier protein
MLRMMVYSLVAVLLGPAASSASTPQEVLERVKRRYDTLSDVELKFEQKVTFALARLEQTIKGTLYMKKQNKYRVELTEQTIVTNGVTVWSYSVPNNQVLIDHFKMNDNPLSPERILTGAPRDFHATALGREKIGRSDTHVLKLVPKDDDAFVTSLKLWVEDGSWLIRKVETEDINGKLTVYSVEDIKLNTGLNDSRFTYEIPPGAEVVDLR